MLQTLEELVQVVDASKVLHSAAVEIMMIMSHMLTLFNKQLQQKVSLHVTEKYNRKPVKD